MNPRICICQVRYNDWPPYQWSFLFAAESVEVAKQNLDRMSRSGKQLKWFTRQGDPAARRKLWDGTYESFRLRSVHVVTQAQLELDARLVAESRRSREGEAAS